MDPPAVMLYVSRIFLTRWAGAGARDWPTIAAGRIPAELTVLFGAVSAIIEKNVFRFLLLLQ